jgi:hypothetical protein
VPPLQRDGRLVVVADDKLGVEKVGVHEREDTRSAEWFRKSMPIFGRTPRQRSEAVVSLTAYTPAEKVVAILANRQR